MSLFEISWPLFFFTLGMDMVIVPPLFISFYEKVGEKPFEMNKKEFCFKFFTIPGHNKERKEYIGYILSSSVAVFISSFIFFGLPYFKLGTH